MLKKKWFNIMFKYIFFNFSPYIDLNVKDLFNEKINILLPLGRSLFTFWDILLPKIVSVKNYVVDSAEPVDDVQPVLLGPVRLHLHHQLHPTRRPQVSYQI